MTSLSLTPDHGKIFTYFATNLDFYDLSLVLDQVMNNRLDLLEFRNGDRVCQSFIHFLKTSKTKSLLRLFANNTPDLWKNWEFETDIKTGGSVTFNVLHVAIIMQNKEVIDHILEENDTWSLEDMKSFVNVHVKYEQHDKDEYEDDDWIFGANAIHLAARFYHQALQKLIEVDNELVYNNENVMKFSPLHITAIAESHFGSRLLLKKGAKVNAVDKYNRTPLYFAAISENYLDVVTLVEEGGANIYFPYSSEAGKQLAPYYIAKSSDILKFLFSKMTAKDLLKVDPELCLFEEIVEKHPSMIEPFLNIFITSKEKDLDIRKNMFQYDLSLFFTGDEARKEKYNMMHRHLDLVESENQDMLLHPIMRAFTDMKWNQFYYKFFINIFFIFMFLVFFSWYGYQYIDVTQCEPLDPKVLESTCAKAYKGSSLLSGYHAIICTKNDELYNEALKNHPGSVLLCDGGFLDKCRKKAWRTSDPDKTNFTAIIECLTSYQNNSVDVYVQKAIRDDLHILEFARKGTMAFLVILIIIEVIQFAAKALKNRVASYFSLQNMVEMLIYVFTILFILFEPTNIELTGHIGGWTLLLAWMNFTGYLSQMSSFGKTILSSIHVTKKILKSLVIFIPSLIGFASAFHFFLHGNGQFQSFFDSFLKVIIMMIGEYEFENNFSFDATREKGGRNFSIQLMFVLFMIYGSVIVMNLIVAIIVNLMDMDQVEAMLQESRVEDISEKIHVTSVYKQCCLWLFRQSQTKNKMEMETGQMIESQIEQQTYPMVSTLKKHVNSGFIH